MSNKKRESFQYTKNMDYFENGLYQSSCDIYQVFFQVVIRLRVSFYRVLKILEELFISSDFHHRPDTVFFLRFNILLCPLNLLFMVLKWPLIIITQSKEINFEGIISEVSKHKKKGWHTIGILKIIFKISTE